MNTTDFESWEDAVRERGLKLMVVDAVRVADPQMIPLLMNLVS